MAFDRRALFLVDWVLLAAVLVLAGVGILTIASATGGWERVSPQVARQTYALAAGLLGLVIVLSMDYHRLVDRAPLLYLLSIGALVWALLFAPPIAGTRRWIVLGAAQIQPSEFVKLAAALVVAKIFSESKKESLGLGDIVGPGAAVAVLVVLIAAAPDLGTAFCLVPLFMAVAFLAGLRMKAVAGLLLALVVVGGVGWRYALKDYQKERVYTFLDPGRDPKGGGYQKIQSQIAVGSGGVTGAGYGQGTQSQLGYLPARHTDFIFSVLAEDLGFVGVSSVLGLYLLLLWRCLEAARLARDRAGAFLAAGLAAVLAFQVVYNVGMVAGLVPVKGLPLPFMSYGGSAILSSMLAIGLILNVRMRRFAN